MTNKGGLSDAIEVVRRTRRTLFAIQERQATLAKRKEALDATVLKLRGEEQDAKVMARAAEHRLVALIEPVPGGLLGLALS